MIEIVRELPPRLRRRRHVDDVLRAAPIGIMGGIPGSGSRRQLPINFLFSSLPGVKLWLRMDASQVTLNSGNAAQVNDRSPSANHATQATAGLQPAWTANGSLNNRPCLTFSATKYLTLASLLPAGAKSFFAVFKPTSSAASQTLFAIGSAGPLFNELLMNQPGYQLYNWCGDRSSAAVAGCGYGGTVGSVPQVGHAVVTAYDGVSTTTPSSYTGTLDEAAQTFVASGLTGILGSNLSVIGCRVANTLTTSFPFVGELYELGALDHVITVGELAKLTSYTPAYYGV